MLRILVIMTLYFVVSTALADRVMYTSELVEGADLIGVWRIDNIEQNGDEFQLKQPDIVLKGEFVEMDNAKQYSSRLKSAMKQVQEYGPFILFIRLDKYRADLVGDNGLEPYNNHSKKAVKDLILQLEFRDKWKTLSVKEQIEKSDIIVSGRVTTRPFYPKAYFLFIDRVYQGEPPESLSVLPVPEYVLNKKSVFFIQRQCGDGPDYIIMHAVSLKDAKDYLKRLKKEVILSIAIRSLRDKDAKVRNSGVYMLWNLAKVFKFNPRVIEALKKAKWKDEDVHVQTTARKALRQLGIKDAFTEEEWKDLEERGVIID